MGAMVEEEEGGHVMVVGGVPPLRQDPSLSACRGH